VTRAAVFIARIRPGPNDRTTFDREGIETLAASIKRDGLKTPPTLRPLPGGDFEIVCGERRVRAVTLLGWATVPAEVEDLDDESASAQMLLENTARAGLDPIDEARAYSSRMARFGWTVEDCAVRAGVTPLQVTFRLKLLDLRADLQALVKSGNLTVGYANILAGAGLDANRQRLAIRELRENPAPTPSWFNRKVVARLLAEQQQETLFDSAALFKPQPAPVLVTDPPHPSTHRPPCDGTLTKRVKAGAEFWRAAAAQWNDLGKVFRAQECIAAALALELALATS
jgi:ParB/RepB/Spo0J family partition protein